jgi:membrane-bound metal-dependent hydrolase YbcI (DUF457 family)
MPTPLGHALGGLAFGWLIAGGGRQPQPSAAHAPHSPHASGARHAPSALDASQAPRAADAPGAAHASQLARLREHIPPDWRRAAVFAMLGALPDIDLLFHAHSTYTHSLGATLLVGLVAWLLLRVRDGDGDRGSDREGTSRAIVALACGAAYGSHVLLDWLGTDTSPPFGITALWPFSSAYFYSGIDLFPAADRRYWLPGFWQRDLTAVAWELILLLPLTLVVLWLRTARPDDRARRS